MKKTLALTVLLFLAGGVAAAQTTHKATITITDTINPTGTTYSIYRATGLCSGTPVFSKLATGIAILSYVDSTVTPGNYCYQVTASVASIEGPPSNQAAGVVLPFAVQISVTVQ